MESKSLDVVIFVGLILPILANNNEQKDELDHLASEGHLRIATISGGAGVAAIGDDLLDHSARLRAAEVGFEDGRRVSDEVKALLTG